MADLFCNMVLVYLMGKWSWVPRSDGTGGRPCALPLHHIPPHRSTPLPDEASSGQVVVRPVDPERDRRRAEYARVDRKAAADALDRWFRSVADGGDGLIPLADLLQVLSDHRVSVAPAYSSTLDVPAPTCRKYEVCSHPEVCEIHGTACYTARAESD